MMGRERVVVMMFKLFLKKQYVTVVNFFVVPFLLFMEKERLRVIFALFRCGSRPRCSPYHRENFADLTREGYGNRRVALSTPG
jgi:hypothetical protein